MNIKYICSKVVEGKCNHKDICKHYMEHYHKGHLCDKGSCGHHRDKVTCKVPCIPIEMDFFDKKEFEI